LLVAAGEKRKLEAIRTHAYGVVFVLIRQINHEPQQVIGYVKLLSYAGVDSVYNLGSLDEAVVVNAKHGCSPLVV
jgi:hypothetical protein